MIPVTPMVQLTGPPMLLLARLLLLLAAPGVVHSPPAPPARRRLAARAYEPRQLHLGYTQTIAGGEISVVVEWVTTAMPPGEGSTSRVLFRRAGGALQLAPAGSVLCGPGSDVYAQWSGVVHEARLRGLAPGASYVYKVGSDEELSDWITFTVPSPYAETTTIALASGIRTGFGAASQLWSRLEQQPPDLLLLPGDLGYGNWSSPEEWDAFFDDGEAFLSHTPATIVGGGLDSQTLPEHHGRGFRLRWPSGPTDVGGLRDPTASPGGFPDWYVVDQGPLRIVSISTRLGADRTCYRGGRTNQVCTSDWLDAAQRSWLDRTLHESDMARNASRPFLVVVGHHPLYSSSAEVSSKAQDSLRRDIEPLLARHGVDLVVWGHARQFERTWPVFDERRLYAQPDGVLPDPFIGGGPLVQVPQAEKVPPPLLGGPVHVNVGAAGFPRGEAYPSGIGTLRGGAADPDDSADEAASRRTMGGLTPTADPLQNWTAAMSRGTWSTAGAEGGYLQLQAARDCELRVEYLSVADGQVLDSWSIKQGLAGSRALVKAETARQAEIVEKAELLETAQSKNDTTPTQLQAALDALSAARLAPLPTMTVGGPASLPGKENAPVTEEILDIQLIPWDNTWDVSEQMQNPAYNWNGHESYLWASQTPQELTAALSNGLSEPSTDPDLSGWQLGVRAPIGFGDKNPTAPTQLSKLIDVFFVRKTIMLPPMECWADAANGA